MERNDQTPNLVEHRTLGTSSVVNCAETISGRDSLVMVSIVEHRLESKTFSN
jgi:hypothetical protein